uniref:Uncharacterized protein n=1 Tax=Rhizophora mucronata TaxID=61149 RepID=A0A2P2J449_RHIMU
MICFLDLSFVLLQVCNLISLPVQSSMLGDSLKVIFYAIKLHLCSLQEFRVGRELW